MKYYSPETCKQLEQLGCVASSGIGYFLHERYLENGEPKSYVTDKEYELAPIENVHFYTYDYLVLPAYSNADFTASPSAKENLKKIWSDMWDSEERRSQEWQYRAHELLDIILSGGDGESFIKEALNIK